MLDFVLKCVIKMFSSDAHFDDHAVFLHVFQLTSTCEQGVLALGNKLIYLINLFNICN